MAEGRRPPSPDNYACNDWADRTVNSRLYRQEYAGLLFRGLPSFRSVLETAVVVEADADSARWADAPARSVDPNRGVCRRWLPIGRRNLPNFPCIGNGCHNVNAKFVIESTLSLSKQPAYNRLRSLH